MNEGDFANFKTATSAARTLVVGYLRDGYDKQAARWLAYKTLRADVPDPLIRQAAVFGWPFPGSVQQ